MNDDAKTRLSEPPPPEPPPPAQPAQPPMAQAVLQGTKTEQNDSAQAQIEAAQRKLREREIKLAEREAAFERRAEAQAAPQKRAWLGGNALFS